jgi:hypothetical protein
MSATVSLRSVVPGALSPRGTHPLEPGGKIPLESRVAALFSGL